MIVREALDGFVALIMSPQEAVRLQAIAAHNVTIPAVLPTVCFGAQSEIIAQTLNNILEAFRAVPGWTSINYRSLTQSLMSTEPAQRGQSQSPLSSGPLLRVMGGRAIDDDEEEVNESCEPLSPV